MNTLKNLPCFEIVIVLLGAILINEFYVQLAFGHFSAEGFSRLMHELVRVSGAPHWCKSVLLWMSEYSSAFAFVFAVITLGGGILLTLLIYRSYLTFLISILFLFTWVSLWNAPSSWIFELLLPALIGLCAAFATWRTGSLGIKFFGGMSFIWRIVIVVVASVALWYAIRLSGDNPVFNFAIAWQTAVTFGFFFLLSAFLDYWRRPKLTAMQLLNISWSNIVMLIIGAMLVMQVYADYSVHWFTVGGYSELIQSYAETSHAPAWFRSFLFWSSEQARYLVFFQGVFESLFAICLSLLILRAPILTLTFGLLFLLMFSEFGVSARWPASPGDPRTWTWELMFVTLVAGFFALQQWGILLQAKTWKQRLIGSPVFGKLAFIWCVLIAFLAGLALYGAGIATHVFGPAYAITSLQAGVTYFVLLVIMAWIDRYR